MRLGTPLPVGGFALSELGVRTGDFGNASVIREEGGDPDEVIVAGDRRRNRQSGPRGDRCRPSRSLLVDHLRQARAPGQAGLRRALIRYSQVGARPGAQAMKRKLLSSSRSMT